MLLSFPPDCADAKKTHHLGRPTLLQGCVQALSDRELLRLWEEGEDEQGASGDY